MASALRLAAGRQELAQGVDFELDYDPAAGSAKLRLGAQPESSSPLAISYYSWSRTICDPD